jgi:hypothetical protein
MAASQNGRDDIPGHNIPFPREGNDSQSILPSTLTVDQTPQLSRSQTPTTPGIPSPDRNGPSQRPSLSSLRTPSIRLRRAASSFGPSDYQQDNELPSSPPPHNADATAFRRLTSRTRPRSASDPQFNLTVTSPHTNALSQTTSRDSHLNLTQMPTVSEEPANSRYPRPVHIIADGSSPELQQNATVTASEALHGANLGQRSSAHENDGASFAGSAPPQLQDMDMDSDMVDVLDVVDPEISTLTTLTNMQNSLVIPNLGRWISRRPVFSLTPQTTRVPRTPTKVPESLNSPEKEQPEDQEPQQDLTHTSTISSTMNETHYAVLPRGKRLSGWTPGEKSELDDHVRHMLHSKRSKFKRSMKGFVQYIKKRKSCHKLCSSFS